METLRKIDYVGQLVLAALVLLSIPILYLYGFLAGLLIMGCWQLISAALNTNAFIQSGRRKQIRTYWKCCIGDLTLILICWFSEEAIDADYTEAIFWIATTGAALIAVYYLTIYNRLLQFISLRNELDGLTKSKH